MEELYLRFKSKSVGIRLNNLEKLDFLIFYLWVWAILGPVEYSTGPKNAKYRPEIIDTLHGSFPKKWRPISWASSKMPLEFVC